MKSETMSFMSNSQEISGTRLFVKNIPPDWDEWSVFHVFKKFGVVNTVQMPPTKPGYQFRFGFVEMLHEKGAKAVLEATRKHQELIVKDLPHPLHVEPCLLNNPRKCENSRPVFQNRPNYDDQQRVLRPSGPRGDGVGNGLMAENGDGGLNGQSQPKRSPMGLSQKRIVEQKSAHSEPRVSKFNHAAIFFEPSIHRHAELALNKATEVTIPLSAIKDPSDFCAIIDGSAAERMELQAKMAEHYKDKTVVLEGVEQDELVVLARGGGGTDRASYNRMLILKGGVGEEKVLGLMVDDTGVMSVACNKLLPITEEFASYPFQAIPCGLYGVDRGAEEWDDEAKQAFISLLLGNDGDTLVSLISYSGFKSLVRVLVTEQDKVVDCAQRLNEMDFCSYDVKERLMYTRDDMFQLRSSKMGLVPQPTPGSAIEEIYVRKEEKKG